MERFLAEYGDQVQGVLSGFDRMIFRGRLQPLCYLQGVHKFLRAEGVWLKDFGALVERLSTEVKDYVERLAQQQGRPVVYCRSLAVDKEAAARQIQERDGIREGLVCVLSCLETCSSYRVGKDRVSKQLSLRPETRKCLHYYFYYIDPEFGWMFVRLQTWLPFTVEVYVNGHHYLARQLDRAGVCYQQADNCFRQIDDVPRAQALFDHLITYPWERWLDGLARRVNPLLAEERELYLHYEWTLRQSEVATDVLFRDAAAVQSFYPRWVDHALKQFSCQDVLRFLGRRVKGNFTGEITSGLVDRHEGMRIKHRVEENLLKMYDKQGSVLRVETTINNPGRFKVYRRMTRKDQPAWRWMPMRKGVADLARRVQVSQAANARYLEALAVVGKTTAEPVRQVLDPVSKRIVRDGRPYRALRPLTAAEAELFRVVLRGEFQVQGFRNRDVRAVLAAKAPADAQQRRRLSGRITRLLRLLRAHALIAKVPTTRYYRVTAKGLDVMTMALRLREINRTALAA